MDHRDRDLRGLLEVTRPITPEELAELQLELGYVERALSIYDELAAREPGNTAYATRRAWLARITHRSGMKVDRRDATTAASSTGPLRIGRSKSVPLPERTLHGLGPRAEAQPTLVRRLPIVRVR